MEDLGTSDPEERQDVFEIGRAGGDCAERRRVGQAATGGKQAHAQDSASQFERAVRVVAVRDSIAGQMERRPEKNRAQPRARDGAPECAGCDVGRHDHLFDDASTGWEPTAETDSCRRQSPTAGRFRFIRAREKPRNSCGCRGVLAR
jgi:hypothetical protein